MPSWYPAKILSNRPAADSLFMLDLDIGGTPLVGAHQRPGQYLSLAVPKHGEGYFAIASAPNPRGHALELLVKRAPGLAETLSQLPAGAWVNVRAIEGQGFPLHEGRGKDVLLFATGSGISPVRSLVDTLLRDRRAFKKVTLFFGVRTPDAFAYAEELSRWEHADIRVIRTVSQPGDSGWQGLTGYVQSHVPDERLDNAVAFLCGQKEMVDGVTEALVRQGLPRENLFLNT